MANNDHYEIRIRALKLGKTLVSLAAEINASGIPCIKQSLSRALHNEVKTERDNDICRAADSILKKYEASQGGA